MGSRGPLKLPPHLSAVPDSAKAGEAADADTALSDRQAPTKPAGVDLDSDLSVLWDEIVPPLDLLGLVGSGDGPVLELLCRNIHMARLTWDAVVSSGLLVPDGNGGTKKHLLIQVWQQQSDRCMELAKQLGMTWMSRARTQVAEAKPSGNGNPFSQPTGAGVQR